MQNKTEPNILYYIYKKYICSRRWSAIKYNNKQHRDKDYAGQYKVLEGRYTDEGYIIAM